MFELKDRNGFERAFQGVEIGGAVGNMQSHRVQLVVVGEARFAPKGVGDRIILEILVETISLVDSLGAGVLSLVSPSRGGGLRFLRFCWRGNWCCWRR